MEDNKEINPVKDKQSNKFLLTINNPIEKGLDHDQIKKTAIENFPTIDFIAMADEKGTCSHTHVFLYFRSRVRWSKVKKYFPEAHIDICKGLVSDNVSYIKKTGKWADTDKEETKIVGTYEEWGNQPSDSRGKRSDMTELYEMITNGLSTAEIISINQDYIRMLNDINRLRTTLLSDKFKDTIRKELKVIYISGVTGAGKTRGVLETHGAGQVYRVTDYKNPFDTYSLQSVIAFDEFRNSLPLGKMLNYLDIYPVELGARYSNHVACYTTAYIISNWRLEQQYSEAQKTDPDSWKAFLRRIHEVWIYTDVNQVEKYPSVEAYFNRDKGEDKHE